MHQLKVSVYPGMKLGIGPRCFLRNLSSTSNLSVSELRSEVAPPPPASMPSNQELATFIITLRSGKSTRGGRSFVKKSAMFSVLLTNGAVMS
eukprot:6199004-Pleurochrysis_carterae.AAC.4